MTPHDLLALATSLARDAGELAFEGRKSGLSSVGTKSTATDMVTEYDRASERLIVDRLRRDRPNDSIIGEEGASFDGTSGIEWCIDPIDGTTNFTYALPNWAVSIGVADQHGPLVGVVHIPPLGETFTAVRGEGALLNGAGITCSSTTEISQALVCTGFSYAAHQRSVQSATTNSIGYNGFAIAAGDRIQCEGDEVKLVTAASASTLAIEPAFRSIPATGSAISLQPHSRMRLDHDGLATQVNSGGIYALSASFSEAL